MPRRRLRFPMAFGCLLEESSHCILRNFCCATLRWATRPSRVPPWGLFVRHTSKTYGRIDLIRLPHGVNEASILCGKGLWQRNAFGQNWRISEVGKVRIDVANHRAMRPRLNTLTKHWAIPQSQRPPLRIVEQLLKPHVAKIIGFRL